jgi:uncharacterized protein with HEPN domain
MTGRSIRPRLEDILSNIDIVSDALVGKRLDAYLADRLLQLAVERAIEIISEATRHIPADACARFPDIPWRNIAAIGNKLRHEYHRVDADIIYDVAANHLPALRPVIVRLLAELD